ncbi:DUF6687 family protein [Pseudomonas protegens]|uniref:DUF6687 family protein n=1 Tax=Pseudomonas protegens TaxID=380021 RepID=UPI002280601F|nr:DUF6687 family protein [Pseudomonas protegens]MCY7259642.1 hypothetical protein [Pseudomonas protegens]
MNSLNTACQEQGFLFDPGVAPLFAHLDLRLLGGRAIGIADNQFTDLLSVLGGPGCGVCNGNPRDLRRENLRQFSYRLDGSGELSSATPALRELPRQLHQRPAPGAGEAPLELGLQPWRLGPHSPYGFLPLGQTRRRSNISLDSIDNPATVLTLSHWPANKTPSAYKANLSTTSALIFLQQGLRVEQAQVITSDHFDLDGLASVYAFLAPEQALRHRQLLIDIARLGDFTRGTSSQALHCAFTLHALAARVRSHSQGGNDRQLMARFTALLPQLADVLDNTRRYAELYDPTMQELQRSTALVEHAATRIEEYSDIDLAIFRLPDGAWQGEGEYFGLSPVALHNRSRCAVLAIVNQGRIEIRQRYESWVERSSGIPRARRDLAIFARALQETERTPGQWHYDGVQAIMPGLRFVADRPSSHSSDKLLAELRQFLGQAPVAWDANGQAT